MRERPDWAGPAWQTARILAACALSYGFARLAGIREAYWALISAVVVTQPALEDTLAASGNRVLATLIGAAVGFLVLVAAQHGAPLFPLFWAALVPLAALTAFRQTLRMSCVTLIVVVLIPAAGPPFERPLDRVYGIALGTAASIIVAAIARVTSARA
jgi:uncharacterized membrane protein YccC